MQLLWVRAMLFAAAFSGALRAQVPSSVVVLKFRAFEQLTATRVEPRGAFVGVQVEFAAPVAMTTTVQLRGPAGTIPLRRLSDGTYDATEEFENVMELNRRAPDGTYTIAVSGPAGGSNTSITLASTAEPPPTRIVNFEQLQAYPTASPHVQYVPIAGYTRGDLVGLAVAREDGTGVFERASIDEANIDTVSINDALPFGERLEAVFTYARLALTQGNNAATNIATGAGFALLFPIRCVTRAAVIRSQGRSQVVPIGGIARLDVTHGAEAQGVTYRLLKDGVPVAAPEPRLTSGLERGAMFEIVVRHPSDAGAYTIELINPGGTVVTEAMKIAVVARVDTTILAGGDMRGAVDGRGATARFDDVRGFAMDAAGNLYASDSRQHTIRKVSPNGDVITFAGQSGSAGSADGTGGEARFRTPSGLALDLQGNLYVADTGNHTIRRITPAGVVTTVAGAAEQRGSMDGAALQARFAWPEGLALDAHGTLFVADTGNRTVRRVSPEGMVTTFAGRATASDNMLDGPADMARFRQPRSLAIDRAGTLYVADGSLAVRRVTPAGGVTTVYGSQARPISVDTGHGGGLGAGQTSIGGIAVDDAGVIYVVGFGGLARIVDGDATLLMPLSYKHPELGFDVTMRNAAAIVVGPDGVLHIGDETRIYRSALVSGGDRTLIAIESMPRAQSVPLGQNLAFSVEATGPGVCYQWFKDGVGLPGATSGTLFIGRAREADVGQYSVIVGNGAGAQVTKPASLTLLPAAEPARLVNLSLRASSGLGAQALTVGLVLAGGDPGTRKNVLVRGVGPTLSQFGVANAMRDPWLTLARSGVPMGTNDNWGGGPMLADAFGRAGAFPLAADSRDAALALPLGGGEYTMQLTPTVGVLNGSGVVLAEMYDLGPAGSSAAPRLVNLSTRASVDGSDALIAGFVVGGSASRTLLIRAMGPTLTVFGVSGAMENPELQIFSSNGMRLAGNDDWSGDATLERVCATVGAFRFQSALSMDAAVLVTVAAGAYTARLAPVGGRGGVALIEVYEVP